MTTNRNAHNHRYQVGQTAGLNLTGALALARANGQGILDTESGDMLDLAAAEARYAGGNRPHHGNAARDRIRSDQQFARSLKG